MCKIFVKTIKSNKEWLRKGIIQELTNYLTF